MQALEIYNLILCSEHPCKEVLYYLHFPVLESETLVVWQYAGGHVVSMGQGPD